MIMETLLIIVYHVASQSEPWLNDSPQALGHYLQVRCKHNYLNMLEPFKLNLQFSQSLH